MHAAVIRLSTTTRPGCLVICWATAMKSCYESPVVLGESYCGNLLVKCLRAV